MRHRTPSHGWSLVILVVMLASVVLYPLDTVHAMPVATGDALNPLLHPPVSLPVKSTIVYPIPPLAPLYLPLASPVRLLDTRPGAQACLTRHTPIVGGSPLSVLATSSDVSTCLGIPLPVGNTSALAGNATVVNTTTNSSPGFVTLYPGTGSPPLASNVNYVQGQVVPNAVTITLDFTGTFSIFASTTVDLVLDITGIYASNTVGGLLFHPLAKPGRLVDTRVGACNARTTPINAGESFNLSATSPSAVTCFGISPSAVAIVGNATVVNSSTNSPAGFATLFPGDKPLPVASNLNYVPGQVVPNVVTVGLTANGGTFNIYASTKIDFVLDVIGYFDTNGTGGLFFDSLTKPGRLVDTRIGGCNARTTPINAGETFNLSATSPSAVACFGISSFARAIIGNATVVNNVTNSPAGFATLFPGSTTLPLASNLNYVPGQVVPNAVIVGLAGDGTFNIYTSTKVDFVLDVMAYFSTSPYKSF